MIKINVCPGSLAKGFHTYSPQTIATVFDGQVVSHLLDFNLDSDMFHSDIVDNIERISISGVQEKLSSIICNNQICLCPPDQQGQYIIKITPAYRLKNRTQLAANEHLSMQIAQQVYGIKTAANAMVFMNDGEQAFITKRFDRCSDGRKIKQEDFASLSQKTAINHGTDYKYTGNYQDIAHLIRLHASDTTTNLERFYQLILFNYLFANGDAHLKNFSLQWTDSGVVLSPAYDLLNTSLHVNDTDFALQAGLGLGLAQSAIYDRTGHPCVSDFSAFAAAIGLSESQIIKVNKPFTSQHDRVSELIQASFLTHQLKRMYYRSYQERLSRLIRN